MRCHLAFCQISHTSSFLTFWKFKESFFCPMLLNIHMKPTHKMHPKFWILSGAHLSLYKLHHFSSSQKFLPHQSFLTWYQVILFHLGYSPLEILSRSVWVSWATCSRKLQFWLCCSSTLTRLSGLCLWGFLSLSPLESLTWSVLPLGFVLWHAQTPSWRLYVPHPHHSQELNYHWELCIVATVMISYITFDLLSVSSHKHTVANLSLLQKLK